MASAVCTCNTGAKGQLGICGFLKKFKQTGWRLLTNRRASPPLEECGIVSLEACLIGCQRLFGLRLVGADGGGR